MSYLALARKWRPTKFKEVVGQAHVLTALENALSQNRLHHAYLFSGTRGVGKTTIGRLFAKGLNCETGITSTPCGECATCKEIDEGRFVDLLEIDAASRTKVEDTRELLDNVQYKPARGRFKVYLIDEVHMLSRHSFNALLKTLEEPPEYVKFLLATTDPQKLPVTILSRCLQFHLKPISVDNIHEQLDHILEQESVTSESRALGMIAHAADGSMRDALSLTDQAIALGNGNVVTDTVAHMLGTLDTDQAIHLLEAISSKQPQQAMACIQSLAENGVEWDGLLNQLATQLHRLAMFQALPSTLDKAQPDAEKLELLSKALSPQDIQLYYQIVLKGREDLPLSPTARVGIEMVVLRMLAFRPAEQAVATAISTQSTSPVAAPAQNQAQSVAQPVSQPVPTAAPRQPQMQQQTSQQQTMQQPVQQQQYPNSQGYAEHAGSQGYPEQDYPHSQYDAPPAYDERPSYGAEQPQQQQTNYQSQSPVQQPSAAPSTPQEQPARATSPVSGLRHQLRSQRRGSAATENKGSAPKKAKATPAKTSVLDRVAQQHGSSERVSPASLSASSTENVTNDNEPYRWKPSKPVVKEVSKELTPTQIKRALEHIKTPEMVDKLLQESIAQDEWSATIQKLETAKLVEQLALNSVFAKNDTSITLTLRASQAHLNTDRAQSELLQSLNTVLGEECHLSVEIGDGGETPLELRERLYQGKLKDAFTALENDANVQFIERRFAAELDRDSVRPI
ncbi:DNA polymerase III subunit gamma/tau [Vibrio sp. 10N.261.46.E12]|uniref:DNA polymerase III subunit gamma/tau n=1 Tax=unclassified Vibrio TaxID=2614977 RepID=UPI0009754D66|nr:MULTISPECIES: DNA polymerase III subunit gamma/tau [unclassified Vibrio]OMO36320.1 DNA polymerase III subunit gamma/tau [Vibrio sp. 10N.261.45.E1]PMJ23323.1 DNA polymerase III subunit gamma/tau [Vibrio sp. 10N.286.45.B6]PML95141.1 DNA polymerase III subunit gamma/tau [Vibrio sp. 10N.261.49.E11]PMM67115.1 DNA polymerase III subunit gamma/tau [Vibrio sp. 10N.261.46.F12]PMM79947.1 DNA polymerase III subunit gamma/tau [Vibrio sp. 10N.261.46.E8]